LTYEMDYSVLHCYDHHNDVSSRIGLGRKAALGDFLPFYSTSHHYGFSRRSHTPSSDRNTFVHLRKKSNTGKGFEHSMRRACQKKRTSSVATFPDFTLLGVLWFIGPRHFTIGGDFLLLFLGGRADRRGTYRGSFGENGLVLYYYGVGFWVDVDRD
jgi:hypothetical protein